MRCAVGEGLERAILISWTVVNRNTKAMYFRFIHIATNNYFLTEFSAQVAMVRCASYEFQIIYVTICEETAAIRKKEAKGTVYHAAAIRRYFAFIRIIHAVAHYYLIRRKIPYKKCSIFHRTANNADRTYKRACHEILFCNLRFV